MLNKKRILAILLLAVMLVTMQTDNALSLLLAKKATENISYGFDAEQTLCNRVDAKIR